MRPIAVRSASCCATCTKKPKGVSIKATFFCKTLNDYTIPTVICDHYVENGISCMRVITSLKSARTQKKKMEIKK